MRDGFGYDVHRFTAGRKHFLGGVEVPHTQGLLGHSDADVLLHAICDAMLGAAALGDIGRRYPDTDEQFKGISSLVLFERTVRLLAKKGFVLKNIDSTVVAQKPKLAPYIAKMASRISRSAGIAESAVSVKATTTEGLGFEGRGKGIAAFAVVLIEEAPEQGEASGE